MLFNRALARRAALGVLLIVVAFWAAAALGSYVYLFKMGYLEDFAFPWNQIFVVMPYVFADGWHGMETMHTWNSLFVAVMAMFAVLAVAAYVAIHAIGYSRTRPLYGETGFAGKSEMKRGGLRPSRTLFER